MDFAQARDLFLAGVRQFEAGRFEAAEQDFRASLAAFLTRRYAWPVHAEHLMVTAGASQALDLVCTRFTKPGDTIFVPEKADNNEPSWLKYAPNRVVQVLGAIMKPGRYEWSDEMSIFDLIATAGGPLARSDISRVQVVKSTPQGATSIVFDMASYINKGGSAADVPPIRAGDIVMIPELPNDPNENKAQWTRQTPEQSIYVMGQVIIPGRYAFNDKLDEAVRQQEGLVTFWNVQIDNAQSAWQSEQRSLKSFNTIADRRDSVLQMAAQRREQKQQDEHATRSAIRSIFPWALRGQSTMGTKRFGR